MAIMSDCRCLRQRRASGAQKSIGKAVSPGLLRGKLMDAAMVYCGTLVAWLGWLAYMVLA